MKTIPIEMLRQYCSYDPETGEVSATQGNKWATDKTEKGYLRLFLPYIDQKKAWFRAHRIAWALYYGEWPSGFLDHKNGNPSDNRICNLRQATALQNQGNRKKAKSNKSGFKGVYLVNLKIRGKQYQYWRASMTIKGRKRCLHFRDKEEAARTYDSWARERFGEFALTNF